MDINQAMKMTADALTKDNARTEVAIVPKYIKGGYVDDMTFTDYKVLMLLYEYVNTASGACYPKQESMAERLGADAKTITKSMKKLEDMGLIKRVPARKVLASKKLETTTNQIIIVPYTRIEDAEYHRQLDEMVDKIKYVVVKYNEDGSRDIIGTGEKTNSMNKKEFDQMTTERSRLSVSVTVKSEETTPVYREEKPTLPTEEEIKKSLEDEIWRISLEEETRQAIESTLVSAIYEVGKFKFGVFKAVKESILRNSPLEVITQDIYNYLG